MVESFFIGSPTVSDEIMKQIEGTPLLAAGERALDVARWNYGFYD